MSEFTKEMVRIQGIGTVLLVATLLLRVAGILPRDAATTLFQAIGVGGLLMVLLTLWRYR